MDQGESEERGLLASLRRLGVTSVSLLQNRLELFALELQEEKTSLLTLLLWGLAAIFFGALAITVFTLTVVFLCPPAARPYVLIGFSAIYLVMTVITVVGLKRRLKNHPPPFSDSIGELKKDLNKLRSPE